MAARKLIHYIHGHSSELAVFFLNSQAAITKWGQLSAWASDPARGFHEAAKKKFLNPESADAWLIAHAAYARNFTIVTNEVSAPESKRSIKLPDAADVLSINTMSLIDLLSKHAGPNFVFKL